MSGYKYLKVAKDEGVARITFDRPKHNVFDIEQLVVMRMAAGTGAGDPGRICSPPGRPSVAGGRPGAGNTVRDFLYPQHNFT